MVTITIMMTMSMTTMRTRKAFIISQKFLKPSFRVGSKVKKSKKKKKNQKMSTTKKPKGSSNYRQSVLTVIVIEGSDLLIVK